MLGSGRTVKEIADACGFSSAACMNRIYVKQFGVTPGKPLDDALVGRK